MIDLYQYKVAWCPICDQGWVSIAKEKSSKKLFLFCDECDSEWDDASNILKDASTRDKYGLIEIPLWEEITEKGWDKYIIKDPYMYDAKIMNISDLSLDEAWNSYAEKHGFWINPTETFLVTIEINGILLKARGGTEKNWKKSLIDKTIKVTNYYTGFGNIEKVNIPIKGILQKEGSVYSVIGDVIEINENGRNFLLDCGEIITAAKLLSGLKDIRVGDRILLDVGEFYISNVELEK